LENIWKVEVGHDGLAPGKHLRVKVRVDISKPLMYGITLDAGKQRSSYRFEYDFFPDLFILLNHIDRECKITLARGEKIRHK
jgi:hypothetical protein